jgi:hypothetical protein
MHSLRIDDCKLCSRICRDVPDCLESWKAPIKRGLTCIEHLEKRVGSSNVDVSHGAAKQDMPLQSQQSFMICLELRVPHNQRPAVLLPTYLTAS